MRRLDKLASSCELGINENANTEDTLKSTGRSAFTYTCQMFTYLLLSVLLAKRKVFSVGEGAIRPAAPKSFQNLSRLAKFDKNRTRAPTGRTFNYFAASLWAVLTFCPFL